MKNCPKGPRGPNDWIPVNHRKKPRENTPTQTPNSENTPPSAPSPPPPNLTTTTTNLSPPSSAHTPPKDPLPIQVSPTKAPSTIMEIDTDPLPSDNDEIIIIDDTGPYVLGLAAVFKDRPITFVSTKFDSLPPSPCITSLNPFAPLLTNPSSSDQPSSSSKTRVSFPPETLTPPLPISSSPVQIITPPSTTKPLSSPEWTLQRGKGLRRQKLRCSRRWPKRTLLRLPKSLDSSVKSTVYTPVGIFFSLSSDVHWSLKKFYYGIMTPSNNKNGSFLSTSITVPLPAEDGQGSYSWPLINCRTLAMNIGFAFVRHS
ncbi:hypothetical protein YC2023_049755 [Brassica napus]